MADGKKKAKKKAPPPVLTPEERRSKAAQQIIGADLAEDFRDQAEYYRKAAKLLQSIPDDPESTALAEQYLKTAEAIQKDGWEQAYQSAIAIKKGATTPQEFSEAASAFQKLAGYQDADQLKIECEGEYERLSHTRSPGLILLGLICILLLGVLIAYQTNWGKYQFGQISLKASRYSSAMNTFLDLDDYRDSDNLEKESRYQLAEQHMEAGRYNKASYHYRKLENYKDSNEKLLQAEQAALRAKEPGDTVEFAEEEWIVLTQAGGKTLLLKKDPVKDRLPYHDHQEKVTWAESSLCGWLNNDYKNTVFTSGEQTLLETGEAECPVFLLSKKEWAQFEGELEPTKWNWWLRSTGKRNGFAAFASADRTVMEYGYPVTNNAIRVRPAIWVNCED